MSQGGKLRPGLILGAIGVVYGDIGTSPLYALQECLSGKHGVEPKPENVLGVVSLILWSITLVVTIKYLLFLMRADNQGEGGIMALLALVPEKLQNPAPGKVGWVALLAVAGAALLYGDGIITPAISVLSAVEGLGVATHKMDPLIVPITVGILIALFAVQRSGTGGLGRLFGPLMVIWFVTIAVLGVRQIVARTGILWALNPVEGARFFAHTKWHGFRVLGSVVLAVTGGEALYADMGHFGRGPIRAAWLALIFPALFLCYLGQGALVLGAPAQAARPFYAMVPDGPWIYPMVALAAVATVIASQALISGVFSLTHQGIRLGYFPRLTVRHTSGEHEGQIYVPLMNWFLAISCIALVLVFRESSRLAAAYGLAVSGTMLITSVVFFVVTHYHWRWPLWKAGGLLAIFLAVDIPFVVANSLKFIDGGYLPFFVGVVFVIVMVVWRIGRSLVADYFASTAEPTAEFLATLDKRLVGRVPGTAVFLSSHTHGIPGGLHRLVDKFHVLYQRAVLLTVTTEHVPWVANDERATVEDVGAGISRVILRYGFMEQPAIPAALAAVGEKPDQLLYVLGRETFVGTSRNKMSAVPETIFELLSRNAKNATDYFGIPPEQVIEIGMRIDL
jgi:KUP system potassium uptake protein